MTAPEVFDDGRGRAAGKGGQYRVSPAASYADAGGRERLDAPAAATTPLLWWGLS